ncbi:copper amine oxidase N-terminal domain-containing protein [Tissierella creatinini]|nr:copper amine oxidase N-terminal domain-containing protein [Tissierella creatinini]TJX63548.1 copper amine oxidase N-terminal domain-containing protein [Soehngenia saccharolytica]
MGGINMNIKRGRVLLLAALITIGPMVVKAEDMEIIPISAPIEKIDDEVKVREYIEFRGKVEEAQMDGENFYIVARNDLEEGLDALRAYIDQDVIILNNKTMDFADRKDLVVGAEVIIYYHKDTIMALSYPPMLGPDVVVIDENDEDHWMSTMVSKFDKEFLNAEKDLYARPSDDTVIMDKDGKELTKEDLAGRDWVIFYDIVLESYPGQTSPKKIIVLPEREELPIVNEFILENQFIKEIKGEKMIPLRLVGESLGYEVSWEQETKTAELVRGTQWTQVTIGEDRYNFAKMLVRLGVAPVLVEDRTYVPMTFIEEILKAKVELVPEGIIIR